MDGCTTCNQSVTDSACILSRPDMIDSEITSNHIWLGNCSLNGETLLSQNGGRPNDIAQSYTGSDNMVFGGSTTSSRVTSEARYSQYVAVFRARGN